MKKLGHDPLAPVLELTPDLHAALESLARRPAAAVHRGSKRAGRG
jgi:hypothetical protein